MNNFWNTNFWSLLALLVAVVSLYYTFSSNKYSIDLTNLSIKKDRGHILIEYCITNDSPKFIKILNVKLSNKDKSFGALDFDPNKYDKNQREIKRNKWLSENPFSVLTPFDFSSPGLLNLIKNDKFLKPDFPISIAPHNECWLKYYVSDVPSKITVSTNKFLGTKRYKSFSTHINHLN